MRLTKGKSTVPVPHQRKNKNITVITWWKLKETEAAEAYEGTVREKLRALELSGNPSEMWKDIEDAVKTAARQT